MLAAVCLLLAVFWLLNAVVAVFSAHWAIVGGSVLLAGAALGVRRWARG